MFKKYFAGAVSATFALASVFAGSAAYAVDRTAGQVNGDWGSTAVNGVAYDTMGVNSDSSNWSASLQDGTVTYVAGNDWASSTIAVQKFNSGVQDMTFGGDGQAEFEIDGSADFGRVSAITLASNGDLVLFGSLEDHGFIWEDPDIEGIFALRITDTGQNSTATFGNTDGDNIDAGSLKLGAYFPTMGMDLNSSWIESWISGAVSFDVGSGLVFAISGMSDGNGAAAWVLFVNEDGTIASGYGDSMDDGITYLDSNFNNSTGQNCYNDSYSNDIVFDTVSEDLYWAVDCDGESAIQALDATSGGLPDSWWAQPEYDEDGFIWVGEQSSYGYDTWVYELEIDSDHNLVMGGETYAYNPDGDQDMWSPWVGRMDTGGTYYVDNSGFAEDVNVHLWDSTQGDGYWGVNSMVLDSDNSIYFAGYRNTGSDNNLWAFRFEPDLQPDDTWNGGELNGNTVIGGCGNEYADTAQISDGNLYLFGGGDTPVTSPDSPFSGNRDAISSKIGLGSFSQTRTVLSAPVWTDWEWQDTFIPGESYTDGVHASGTGVSYYLYNDLPGGVSLNGATGVISGTTDVNDTGSYGFKVCAANAGGHVWTDFNYISAPSPYAPVIDTVLSLDDVDPYMGDSLEWTIPVDAVPVAYCWVNDGELPPGLTLDEQTCVISGTPLIKGDYWFEIGAENSEGSDYQEYSGSVGGTINTAISASLVAELGDVVEDSDVDLLGFGLEPGSDWYAELHSDPVQIADGIANQFGWFSLTTTLPSDIAPGEHTITVYGTDVNGHATSAVVYITVKADGTLGYISSVQAESASLASTGVDEHAVNSALLVALALLTAGIAVVVRRRRS